METENTVLSRHRLPQPYRWLLIVLWLMPAGLLVLAIIAGKGVTPALFDPRFLLLLGLMALPAYYTWQEGVDVLAGGIVARVHWPRYYAYDALCDWRLEDHQQRVCLLTIWDSNRHKVFSYYAAHLSDLPLLLKALETHVDDST